MIEDYQAYKYAIKLLSKRDYSIHKLKIKMLEREYPLEEIEETIECLLEKRYLREENYIDARVRGLARKGHSASSIQYRLKEENVFVQISDIFSIFQELGLTEEEQLKELINKKLSAQTINDDGHKQKIKSKVLRFVQSKGHNFEKALSIINAMLN